MTLLMGTWRLVKVTDTRNPTFTISNITRDYSADGTATETFDDSVGSASNDQGRCDFTIVGSAHWTVTSVDASGAEQDTAKNFEGATVSYTCTGLYAGYKTETLGQAAVDSNFNGGLGCFWMPGDQPATSVQGSTMTATGDRSTDTFARA